MQHEEKGRHGKRNALQRSETDRPGAGFLTLQKAASLIRMPENKRKTQRFASTALIGGRGS
jgi:hypothetical protein